MTLYEMKQMEREEGNKEGHIGELLDMVSDGLVSYDVAARRAKEKYDIKEDDFQKMLKEHQENKNS